MPGCASHPEAGRSALTTSQYWDQFHRAFVGITYPQPHRYRSHLELQRLFQKWLPQQPGLRLIELGCGGSIWLPYFVREFRYAVAGIDYSAVGIRRAHQNLAHVGGEGVILQLDFRNIPREWSAQFDIAVSLGVVEHFPDFPQLVRTLTNLLKPGGLLLTWVPNTTGWIFFLQRILDSSIYRHHVQLTLADLSKCHCDAGLSIVAAGYHRFLDLSILNLTTLPPVWGRVLGRLLQLVDSPWLALSRFGELRLPWVSLASAMYVIGQKPPASGALSRHA